MNRERLVAFFLRVGLSVAFLYASIAALLEPDSWAGFIPLFLRQLIAPETFLVIHSGAEILLALWLLSGVRSFAAASVSACAMAGVVLFNLGSLDVVFRDIAIFFMALALAAMSKR